MLMRDWAWEKVPEARRYWDGRWGDEEEEEDEEDEEVEEDSHQDHGSEDELEDVEEKQEEAEVKNHTPTRAGGTVADLLDLVQKQYMMV